MAYADIKLRPSPASMGAAIAVNALIIAGIILAAPLVTSDPADPPLMIDIFAAPPPPKAAVAVKLPSPEGQSAKPQHITRPDIINNEIASTNELLETGTILPPLSVPVEPIGDGDAEPIITQLLFKDATVHPRYRGSLQPDYPPGLIRQKIEGAVTIRVHIGTDGRVTSTEPVRFDNPELLRVTEQHALRKWRFLPATRDGVPVESWREMSVRFQIPD